MGFLKGLQDLLHVHHADGFWFTDEKNPCKQRSKCGTVGDKCNYRLSRWNHNLGSPVTESYPSMELGGTVKHRVRRCQNYGCNYSEPA